MRMRYLLLGAAVALAAGLIATTAIAASGGAANQVALGVQQSNPTVSGDAPVGDATFVLTNLGKAPVYDLSMYISQSCPYDPAIMNGGPKPLALAGKPARMNPAQQSFSGSPYGLRWHIVRLVPSQTLRLKLRFKIPSMDVPVPSPYDPSAPATDITDVPTAPVPSLCLVAGVAGDTDNSVGSSVQIAWEGNLPDPANMK